tara:strand:+ start:380 stop:943 length:564 start_codon:yes stop_codon:yes gene_type:complete
MANINTTNNKVTVTQGITKIVTVTAPGPQGPPGPSATPLPTIEVNDIIEFLNINVTHESSNVISSNTIRIVEASFATVPSGFPALTKFDFQCFLNGVYIPPSNITSINEDTNTNPFSTAFSTGFGSLTADFVDVIFNTSLLGFTLTSGDTLSIIGKFNNNAYSSGFSNGFSAHNYNFVSQTSSLVFT